MESTNQFLVYNAKIWSPEGIGKDLSWMVFNKRTGYIIKTGVGDPEQSSTFSDEQKLDANGRRILPGLHESHIHVLNEGIAQTRLSLSGCASIKELQNRLKTHVEKNNSLKWIVSDKGWEQDKMGSYPCRQDLDEICSDRPVVLYRACHHVLVCNTRALEVAGITHGTPNPPGGVIDKYPSDHSLAGEPSGILRESPAISLLLQHLVITEEEKKACIREAANQCLANGVTSAHACEDLAWKEYCEVDDRGELPIRIFFSAFYVTGKDSDNFPKAGEVHSSKLSCDRVKLFADGSLGASTAFLSQPYRCSHNRGVPIHSQEKLSSYVHDATVNGYRLEIHVIGDGAAENALNAIEFAGVSPEKRPILTHCQVLRKGLVEKMAKYGVIANIQPQFVPTDARWAEQMLPPVLLDYAYAWKTLLNAGVHCAGGSDAPIESPEPLQGIYDAIFRKIGSRAPANHAVFKPEERLSVQEAIDLYTKGGAYATMREHDLGQLRPGYQADFIMLEEDACERPELFLTVKVTDVWVAGQKKL